MFSPFTPLNKFKTPKLVSLKKKHDIVDLQSVMGDTKKEKEQLE